MTPCPTPQKLCYETRKHAKQAARRTDYGKLKRSSGRLHAYLCVCGSYHVGTMTPRILAEGRPRGEKAA